MALADDLLEVAQDLADLDAANPREATRRRSISTAYYALFHLLISEAVSNWKHAEQRYILARQFEHGPMNAAALAKTSELEARLKNNFLVGEQRSLAESLLKVTSAFVTAQEARFEADYNLGKEAAATTMRDQLEAVRDAFDSWKAIREQPEAQMFLLSLLATKRSAAKETRRYGDAPPKG
jgi:uncharacterized protein (UPF0332 family)